MDEKELGIEDDEDRECKAQFGAMYEAIRILIDNEQVRPWDDLPEAVQFLFTLMVGSTQVAPNAANTALMTLVSFMAFLNTPDGENAAVLTRKLGR